MLERCAPSGAMLLALASLACGGEAPEPQRPKAGNGPSSASAQHQPSAEPTSDRAAAAAPSAAPEPPEKLELFPGSQFPPTDIPPPFERSAQPGDGKWVPAEEAGEVDGSPFIYRTSLRPHLFKRFAYVNIAAIDLSRAEIHLVPGTQDPVTKAIPDEQRTGLVPSAHQPQLTAVFNGGFMTKHGGHGMGVGGVDLVPPRDELCTVALLDSGKLRIGSWSNIQADKSTFRAWRQSPWCLIEGGTPNPVLKTGQQRKYGMSAEGKLEIRRSAIGLSPDGRTLYYAVGEEQTPELIAKAMEFLGVKDAMQLDINWSYTRFFFFGEVDGTRQITSTLLPKMKHSKAGYVTRAEPRDFFYVLRRPSGATKLP